MVDWIRVSFLCESLSCLPNPGGLFQQAPQDMWKIDSVLRAWNKWENEEISRGSEH